MLTQNRFSRYLLYAIGEIILVVIGILIALQINNWNEKQKEQNKQNVLLQAVLADFKNDSNQLLQLKNHYRIRLLNFKHLDTIMDFGSLDTETIDSIIYSNRDYFYRPPSFEFSTGAYEALVNNGEAIAYRNPQLFSDIQEIQIKINHHLESIYETIKTAENQVNWKWNYEIRQPNFNNLNMSIAMVKDLAFLHEHILLYYEIMDNAEAYINEIIIDLTTELEKSK